MDQVRPSGTSTSGAQDALRVRTYEPGDERAILQIFERVFGYRRSIEKWRWQYRQAPGGSAPILVLDDDGPSVGHLGHVGVAVWAAGRRTRLALGCDAMVLPEYRGRGGIGSLVHAFLELDHGFDIRMGFPADQMVALLGRYGGGVLLGRVPRWVRLLERPSELGAAGRLAARAHMGLQGRLASMAVPRLEVRPLEELGPEIDRLAEASASFAPCIRIRDAAYLRWRWLEQPGSAWTILGAREGGELRGFAVSGVDDGPFGTGGRVVDLLARDPTALRALLLESVRHLAADGCDRVICDYHDPRSWAGRAFLEAGFVPRRDGLKVVCRGLSERAGSLPERLDCWYLTRGDTDLA